MATWFDVPATSALAVSSSSPALCAHTQGSFVHLRECGAELRLHASHELPVKDVHSLAFSPDGAATMAGIARVVGGVSQLVVFSVDVDNGCSFSATPIAHLAGFVWVREGQLLVFRDLGLPSRLYRTGSGGALSLSCDGIPHGAAWCLSADANLLAVCATQPSPALVLMETQHFSTVQRVALPAKIAPKLPLCSICMSDNDLIAVWDGFKSVRVFSLSGKLCWSSEDELLLHAPVFAPVRDALHAGRACAMV